MEISSTVAGLNALAQESRLKIFRLLVQREPDGMAAGDIARRLKLPQNTLSFHVGILARARLVTFRKDGRRSFISSILRGRALCSPFSSWIAAAATPSFTDP
jgi:ArsR family transcriptional regulator